MLQRKKHPDYYDEWWNGRQSGNIDFDLAPSEELFQAFITDKTIDWPEYKKRFYTEIKNNPKAQKALDFLANYNGIVTLLCYCKDENLCHRSLVKEMIEEKEKEKEEEGEEE